MAWSIFSKLTGSLVKSGTGIAKDLSGTAKDVTSIRKDLVETKLAQRRLEREESPIQLASFQDVKEFDPKYETIRRQSSTRQLRRMMYGAPVSAPFISLGGVFAVVGLILLASAVLWFVFGFQFFKIPAYVAAVLVTIFLLIVLIILAIGAYTRVSNRLRATNKENLG